MELHRADEGRRLGQTAHQGLVRRQGLLRRRGGQHLLVGRALPLHARARALHRVQTAAARQRRVVRVAQQDLPGGGLLRVLRLHGAQSIVRQVAHHSRGTSPPRGRELQFGPEFAGENGRSLVRAFQFSEVSVRQVTGV